MNETSPPLKVWLYTIITVVVLLLISAFVLKTENKKRKTDYSEYNTKIRKILIKNNNSNTNKSSVVFLGSSLTGHALYNLPLIDKKFRLNNNQGTNSCTIAINALNNEKIADLQLFDELINHPPDYLFIEINHVLIDDQKQEIPFWSLHYAVNNLFLYAKNALGMEPEPTINFFTVSTKNPLFGDQFNTAIYDKLLEKKRLVREFETNKILNNACKALQHKKTKIIFLDLPRGSRLEKIWLNTSQKIAWQAVLEKYKLYYKIDLWRYPYVLNNSDFTDGGHLNYKGAKKYQDWIISQFKSQQ